ncbi:hypothetical protein MPER_15275, partial [Moniliophthora perniciosa FA553]
MFMELPSRKEWPVYYKEIKRPQCFENIFKRIKRKEYQNSSDFAADVELVFSNALHFNQEHSQVWEDAATLRYSKPSNNKIKIKMPATHPSPTTTTTTTSHSQAQPTA